VARRAAIPAAGRQRPGLGERRLPVRAGFALVVANARYWTGVAPLVRRELARWERRAGAIADAELKALALAKLDGEGFHAEAAAMFATLAPRARRPSVVEAIVALELLFDYLDGLTERPASDPLRAGEHLFGALRDAFAVRAASAAPDLPPPAAGFVPPAAGFAPPAAGVARRAGSRGADPRGAAPRCADGGYLEELSDAVAAALAHLPAAPAVAAVAQTLARRAGEAQTRIHAAAQLGLAPLREWAAAELRDEVEPGDEDGGDWRLRVAGAAASVLALHALIAAAADPATTPRAARRIAETHLATSVLLTLLDGLVDEQSDSAGVRRPRYLDLFADRAELPETLARTARRALTLARGLPGGARHAMLLTAAVAYYGSAPGAGDEGARVAIARVQRELEPLIVPTLALMRAWRGAQKLSSRRRVPVDMSRPVSTSIPQYRGKRLALGVIAAGLLALGLLAPAGARAAHTLGVRDEGRLHYVKSSGSAILDEGRASGTLPGWVRVRFFYDGEPTASASFTIAAPGGTIDARGSARLSSPNSLSPSFHGTLTITGGSGRYAHARGRGQLYGIYYRRSYGLVVQAIATLVY
jgi:hypothetical protein